MTKEKLFKSEDFDKYPKPHKKNLKKWVLPVLIGALLAVIVVIGIILATDSHNSDSTPAEESGFTTEIEQDSSTAATNAEIESAQAVNIEEASDEVTEATPQNDTPQDTATGSGRDNVQSGNPALSDIETEALKVIRGDYGNNPERKNTLGEKYRPIQRRVNQLKRQGVF